MINSIDFHLFRSLTFLFTVLWVSFLFLECWESNPGPHRDEASALLLQSICPWAHTAFSLMSYVSFIRVSPTSLVDKLKIQGYFNFVNAALQKQNSCVGCRSNSRAGRTFICPSHSQHRLDPRISCGPQTSPGVTCEHSRQGPKPKQTESPQKSYMLTLYPKNLLNSFNNPTNFQNTSWYP